VQGQDRDTSTSTVTYTYETTTGRLKSVTDALAHVASFEFDGHAPIEPRLAA
jgi:hypothetical protein